MGVSSSDFTTPIAPAVDPTTHRLLTSDSGGGGGSGGTSSVDDSAFAPGTDSVTPAGGFYDDTATDSVDEGDVGALRMSANRNLYTQIRDAAGNERGVSVSAANALKVDGSAVTQPVSAASLPLPSGAATAAKQPALGTAGSASADVITVQGIASMTALKVDGSAVTQPVSIASVPSHAVTNAGTFVVQENGAALTSLQLIDDTIATTASAIPSKGVAISGTDGTNARVLKTDTSGELQVDVLSMPTTTVTAANLSTNVAQLAGTATDTNSGNKSAGTLRVVLATDQPQLTNKLLVTPDANSAVNVAQMNGTAVTMGNGAAGTGVQRVTIANDSTGILAGVTTVTTLTGGGIAHDGADSGNPIKVGAKAITSLKTTTLVASADRTDNQSDLDGALLVRSQFPLGDLISERVSDTGGTSSAFSNFGAVASTKNYITGVHVFNTSATAGYIDFRDGTAGSVLFTLGLPAGGGAVLPIGAAPWFKTTANTALAYDVSAALSTVYISISGFQSKL
jgi:hypothetical protein